MKSILEEGFIGVDMPPLPDDLWQGFPVLRLTEATFFATSSDTLATWSSPSENPITTQGENRCNGIIRWYDPVTGRWLSNDPIGISGGLNQYVFCANNPVNFRDPSGLWEIGIGGGCGLAGKVVFGHNTKTGRWSLDIGIGAGGGIKGFWKSSVYDEGCDKGLKGKATKLGVEGEVSGALGTLANAGVGARSTISADWYNNYVAVPEVFGTAGIGPVKATGNAGLMTQGRLFDGRPDKVVPSANAAITIGKSVGLFGYFGGVGGISWGGNK